MYSTTVQPRGRGSGSSPRRARFMQSLMKKTTICPSVATFIIELPWLTESFSASNSLRRRWIISFFSLRICMTGRDCMIARDARGVIVCVTR